MFGMILSWFKGRAVPSKPEAKECPSCPNCGHATSRSWQDYTFTVGGNEEYQTKPIVSATVTVNIPVFRCLNKNCNTCQYGEEAEEVLRPIQKVLTANAIPEI
jgi:hypothetical protein